MTPLDEALEIAAKSALVDVAAIIQGNETEHALYAYSALQTVASAYVEARDRLADAQKTVDELIGLLQQRMEAEEAVPVVERREFLGSVEWRGPSAAYFDHMEDINHELASAFADVIRNKPNRAETPEIEPPESP